MIKKWLKFYKSKLRLPQWKSIIGVLVTIIIGASLNYIPLVKIPKSVKKSAYNKSNNLTLTLKYETFFEEFIAENKVSSNYTASITTSVAQPINQIFVKEGDIVKKNDLLYVLEPSRYKKELRIALQTFSDAKKELEAAKSLTDPDLVSEQELLELKKKYQQTYQTLNHATTKSKYYFVRSPITGIVSHLNIEKGTIPKHSEPSIKISDISNLKLVVIVPHKYVAHLKKDDKIAVQIKQSQSIAGTISNIERVRYVTNNFDTKVTIKIDEIKDKPNLNTKATVVFSTPPKKAHFIKPEYTVINEHGTLGVYIVNKNKIINFYPINIISQELQGIWITGLPDTATIIYKNIEKIKSGKTLPIKY